MTDFFKKIARYIKTYWFSFIYGMKNTEDIVFHQNGASVSEATQITQQTQTNSIAQALLRGEVTQDVEELRYRTYLVDRESKKYKYYTPTLAIKKQDKMYINIAYDDSDGLDLITSQINDIQSNESYENYINNIVQLKNEANGKDSQTEINNVNAIVNLNNSSKRPRIEIIRDGFVPTYKIENYATRIDVKSLDESHAILDIFVSKYPNNEDFKSRGFISELMRIMEGNTRSNILSIKSLSFVTSHAYKMEDMVKFIFDNVYFKEIKEFDGHYILRFKAMYVHNAIDLTDQYYSKTMDEKYKNKEKKKIDASFNDFTRTYTYVCEECGKEIKVDGKLIDELESYGGRDITEEEELTERPNVMEFMDMQIAEQTFGRKLCSDCLSKYLIKHKMI